jgi:mRNA interferase MazF
MAKARLPQRGEIWPVQFDPSVRAEIRKIRPAVVVSLDTIGRLPLRIVVPLTDWQDPFAQLPWFVALPASPSNGLTKDSGADAFQVKSISESRIVRYLGHVTNAQLDDIASAVAMCVGAP